LYRSDRGKGRVVTRFCNPERGNKSKTGYRRFSELLILE
jgi:hypothetical protein